SFTGSVATDPINQPILSAGRSRRKTARTCESGVQRTVASTHGLRQCRSAGRHSPGPRSDAVRSPSLSIVIPAYNEAFRIGDTLMALCAVLPSLVDDWEVRVVDDGSRDATAAVVAEFAHTHTGVVLQPEPHRGKGGAVRAGMLAARGDLRFLCDADLSMPPTELPRFLALAPARSEEHTSELQ